MISVRIERSGLIARKIAGVCNQQLSHLHVCINLIGQVSIVILLVLFSLLFNCGALFAPGHKSVISLVRKLPYSLRTVFMPVDTLKPSFGNIYTSGIEGIAKLQF